MGSGAIWLPPVAREEAAGVKVVNIRLRHINVHVNAAAVGCAGTRLLEPGLPHPIDLCEGALPLGHVFVEASTTRGHGEFWRDADAATVACQKSGIYPTFDSAARLG